MPDNMYLKLMFRLRMGRKLDLRNPQSWSEKIQWLKLYNRKTEYSHMVDKYESKQWAASRIGEEHIIKTIGIYDTFSQIPFGSLPEQFVIKCTHDSGGLVICKNIETVDWKSVEKRINRCLKKQFWKNGREWVYKGVKPRINIEEYIEQSDQDDIDNWKFYCVNGEPFMFFLNSGGHSDNKKYTYFNMDKEELPIKHPFYDKCLEVKLPDNFDEMVNIARKLSDKMILLRVDLYNVDGKIYFGEVTFYPDAGYNKIEPISYDYVMGKYIELPKEKICGENVMKNSI